MVQEYYFSAQDGTALFAREWLPDVLSTARGAVVLVHGIGEHSGRYGHVANFLLNRSIPTIGFDLRGHGRSQGPRGDTPSYDQLLEDIGSRIRRARSMFPHKKVFLYGHSLGGNLVLNFVLRRMAGKPPSDPVDGIIASGPALRLAFHPPAWKMALAYILIHIAPGVGLPSGLKVTAISRDPEVVETYRNDPLVHDRVTSRFFLGFYSAGQWALEHANQWPRRNGSLLPALLTFGTQDQLVSSSAIQSFAQIINNTAISILPWEGFFHEVHNEPEQNLVLEAFRDWLDRQLLDQPSSAKNILP
jgi:alpha-beta hydrolase superfamily lysophospholipase